VLPFCLYLNYMYILHYLNAMNGISSFKKFSKFNAYLRLYVSESGWLPLFVCGFHDVEILSFMWLPFDFYVSSDYVSSRSHRQRQSQNFSLLKKVKLNGAHAKLHSLFGN
jgi:hypothetical protein